MINIIDKLKTLKELKPDKEWVLFTMDEIIKTKISPEISPQSTLLQKLNIFVKIHINTFKIFAASAITAILIIGFGFGIFIQQEQNNLLIDRDTQVKINSILAETEKINSKIRVEVDENRVTEENQVLIALLDQRIENRLKLQSIISKEIDNIKIRREKELTNQDIELLILAQKANDVENFHLALFVLENIRD